MQTVGHINIDIYRCVTDNITTDEVIITDERIEHIKEHHPNDFERFSGFLKEIIESPDYILKANREKTAVILKEIEKDGERFKTILRLVTATDNSEFKNSILTFMKIDEKDWNRLLRNKKVLYKRE